MFRSTCCVVFCHLHCTTSVWRKYHHVIRYQYSIITNLWMLKKKKCLSNSKIYLKRALSHLCFAWSVLPFSSMVCKLRVVCSSRLCDVGFTCYGFWLFWVMPVWEICWKLFRIFHYMYLKRRLVTKKKELLVLLWCDVSLMVMGCKDKFCNMIATKHS